MYEKAIKLQVLNGKKKNAATQVCNGQNTNTNK